MHLIQKIHNKNSKKVHYFAVIIYVGVQYSLSDSAMIVEAYLVQYPERCNNYIL